MTLKERFCALLDETKLVQESDRILVAFSGGKDSVCLLTLLSDLSPSFGFSVGACHVHHGIRGSEADRDAAFCRNFCRERAIPFSLKKESVPDFCKKEGVGLEEGARILRYRALEEAAKQKGYTKIATAHTASDQAETVLFRLIRGSGFAGLEGIPEARGNIIRPLLSFYASEIEAYMAESGFPFISDSSNADMLFSRNRIRNEVMPALKKVHPAAEISLVRFASLCTAQNRTTSALADRWEKEHGVAAASPALPLKPLTGLAREKAGQVLLFEILSRKTKNENIFLDSQDFVRLVGLLKEPKEGKIIEISAGFHFRVEKGFFLLEHGAMHAAADAGIEYPIEPELPVTQLPAFDAQLTRSDKRSGKVQNINKKLLIIHLASDKIKGELFVRPRRSGDRLRINGCTKSVKKLFQEAGIPERMRGYIPLICDEEGIVWVPFCGLCDRVRKSDAGQVFTLSLSGKHLCEIAEMIERT